MRYSTVTDLARLRGWSTSVPARDRHVVGEQLERDDREDRRERVVRVGHPADVVGEPLDLDVALGRDRDDAGVASATLHDVADDLVVDRRARDDRHERALGIEQRDRSVLELAGRVALGMDVADFLELERALERGRVARIPRPTNMKPREFT